MILIGDVSNYNFECIPDEHSGGSNNKVKIRGHQLVTYENIKNITIVVKLNAT